MAARPAPEERAIPQYESSMGSQMHRRGLALSFAALATALLLLGMSASHAHMHGREAGYTPCRALPDPELYKVVSLLEAPQLPLFAATPLLGAINLTLVEAASSLSFRGPPE
jgi:hypothetical protein